jgi:hypothetical protein
VGSDDGGGGVLHCYCAATYLYSCSQSHPPRQSPVILPTSAGSPLGSEHSTTVAVEDLKWSQVYSYSEGMCRKLVDNNDKEGVLHIDYPAHIVLSAGLPAEAGPGLTVPPHCGAAAGE